MRRAQNNGFLLNGKGNLCGVNLGADYCAEHEWGIKDIRRSFGLSDDPNIVGIERRRINRLPDYSLELLKTEDHWTLVFNNNGSADPELNNYKFRSEPTSQELYTAWSERDFAVRVYSDAPNAKKNKKHLEELYRAFQDKRIAIWVGGGGVFENGGLILAIIDRCPHNKLQEMKDADIEKNRLKESAEKINKDLDLENRLRAAGKGWFALAPSFCGDSWSDRTVFDVIYYLNPMDQFKHCYGWVTVEDLVAWINNEGPIMDDPSNKGRAGSVSGQTHVQKGVFGKK